MCPKEESTFRDVKSLVNEKLHILQDFGVVNSKNYGEIRNDLLKAIKQNPDRDPQVVLDRAARPIINAAFGE